MYNVKTALPCAFTHCHVALNAPSRSGRFIAEEKATEWVPIWTESLIDSRANLEVQDNVMDWLLVYLTTLLK
jgi:hypothetical protein